MSETKTEIPDLKGKTILIVEDEEINLLLIETFIQPTFARTIHAWNGEQSIDLVRENRNIDLILMDMKLPIMDGYQATREIKKISPQIPIVAQTAYALGDDKILCFNAGCDDYLSKPIRKNLLYSILAAHLLSDQQTKS